MIDYQLKPIGKTCAATGEALVPGTACHSVLLEREGEWVRLDFSEDGWSGPPEGSVGHWQAIVPEPEADKPRQLDPDSLMQYFEQLVEDANPAQDKFLYVLALLLLQKRRLKLDGSRQEGETEYLQLVGSRGEGPYEVRDQTLSAEEVEQLQGNLNSRLAAE